MIARDRNRPATTGKSHRWLLAAIATTLALLLGGFATLILTEHGAAEQALVERFATRAALTADFTRHYIDDIAIRERRQAEQLLSEPQVARSTFEQVVKSLDFEVAILLDGKGDVLQVWPRRPDLIGSDATAAYPHLRSAVLGRVAVSELVPSPDTGVSVAGIAVPYQGTSGRRVLSGGFSPTTTPLGSYFSSAISIAGGAAYLVDWSGNVLTQGQDGIALPVGAGTLPVGISEIDGDARRLTVVVAEVAGAPWRVVLTVPSATLLAPIDQARWAPWSLLVAFAVAGTLLLMLVSRLGRARVRAAQTAHTDALTGLPNRRAIDEMLGRVAAHAGRHGDPLAVLMIDLDHFKSINDTHGHDVGDRVLREVAGVLSVAGRDEDMAGRWGGEEFLVVLQSTSAIGAAVVAERLRLSIAALEVAPGRLPVRVTASIGVALLAPGGDPSSLLRAADSALYRAKAQGRNAVDIARPTGPAPSILQPSLV